MWASAASNDSTTLMLMIFARYSSDQSLSLDGNCHVYVDADADLAMALAIVDNAKTQKVSPCNAAESLLVHAAVAERFLPTIGATFAKKGVEMRCDDAALAALAGVAGAKLVPASALCTILASARFDASASEPPRRMHALPLLIASDAASIVTFGRLS